MKQIILKSKKGNIAIMNVIDEVGIQEAIKKFQDCHPEFIDYFLDNIELPASRLFRDAWTLKNGKVVVDEKKAKEILLARVRRTRNLELEKLDTEQLKHLGTPGMIIEIDQKKQVLRDLPNKIEGLEWPKELPSV